MSFELPKLAYTYNALEPFIDSETMKIHYEKHHGAYTKNLNDALASISLKEKPIETVLVEGFGQPAIRNNAGGYYNHNLFWQIIGPNKGGSPKGILAEKIAEAFGSFEEFKKVFASAAAKRFGSGWAWLCFSRQDQKLKVFSTANQDNPIMPVSENGIPILGLDVWEHAYYLKYQNRRAEYIDAFWNIVNWDQVLLNYQSI